MPPGGHSTKQQALAPTVKIGSRKPKDRLSMSEQTKMIELIGKGLNQSDVAKVLDRPADMVGHYFRAFTNCLMDIGKVKDYRELKSDMLEATEARMIESLNDPIKIASASLRDVALSFKEVYMAGRMERGLSTKNVHTAQIRVVLPSKPPVK